jgi:hypothetical protein
LLLGNAEVLSDELELASLLGLLNGTVDGVELGSNKGSLLGDDESSLTD